MKAKYAFTDIVSSIYPNEIEYLTELFNRVTQLDAITSTHPSNEKKAINDYFIGTSVSARKQLWE